jgi:Ca-activated chloride channel family protein
MRKPQHTYSLRKIALALLVWECLFFALLVILLAVLGYFSGVKSKEHFDFKTPELLYLFVLLPIISASFLYLLWWKNKRFTAVASQKVLSSVLKPISSENTFIKYFFFRNTLAFLILAAAQPVFGVKKVSGTKESMELVLALDISNSMNTRDLEAKTSRLEVAKRAIVQLLNSLHGERIGLCIFAGNAYVQLPITSDYEAAKLFVQEIETNMISNQGTNISAALDISTSMFSKLKTGRAICIITDGEDHTGNLEIAIAGAKKEGIQIAILGIGTQEGGFIPNRPERPEFGFKVDEQGNPVLSKLNPRFISSLANKTEGYYLLTSSPYPDLSALIKPLKNIKRTALANTEFEVREHKYQIPLLAALFSFMLYLVWSNQLAWRKRTP